MVGRWNLLGMALSMYEERIYEWVCNYRPPTPPLFCLSQAFQTDSENYAPQLLRSPTFHAGVRRIHRTLHERKHGRDPNEPLRPGEATTEQPLRRPGHRSDSHDSKPGFFKYFVEEMRNQLRGTPTEDIHPRPGRGKRRS